MAEQICCRSTDLKKDANRSYWRIGVFDGRCIQVTMSEFYQATGVMEEYMKQIYTDFKQLPIMLNADQLAQALGISRAGAYQLMHTKGFPTIRIGKRMVVPKEKLIRWLEEQLQSKETEAWPW